MRIRPRPEIGVDEIHADRLGLDQHLTGPGGGPRLLDERKVFRSAGLLDSIAYMVKHSNAGPIAVHGFSDNAFRFAL
jgi:hypothetical protein